MTVVQIGPYQIHSDDAFLSQDDVVIDIIQAKSATHKDVSDYLKSCGSEVFERWQQALQGQSQEELTVLERDYFECGCKSAYIHESDELATFQYCGGQVQVPLSYLFLGSSVAPVFSNETLSCENPEPSYTIGFLLHYGAKKIETDANGDFSNCFGYAFAQTLGLPGHLHFDLVTLLQFKFKPLARQYDQVQVYNDIPEDVEKVLEESFVPVGFLSAKDFEMPSGYDGQFVPRPSDVSSLMGSWNRRFQRAMNRLEDEGQISSGRAKEKRYVLMMSQRVANETPDGKEILMTPQHASVLVHRGGEWMLESKLSTGEDVYLADFASTAFVYNLGAKTNGFLGSDLFYTVYEVSDDQSAEAIALNPSILREDVSSHGFFFKTFDMPKVNYDAFTKDQIDVVEVPSGPISSLLHYDGQKLDPDSALGSLLKGTGLGFFNYSPAMAYSILDADGDGRLIASLDSVEYNKLYGQLVGTGEFYEAIQFFRDQIPIVVEETLATTEFDSNGVCQTVVRFYGGKTDGIAGEQGQVSLEDGTASLYYLEGQGTTGALYNNQLPYEVRFVEKESEVEVSVQSVSQLWAESHRTPLFQGRIQKPDFLFHFGFLPSESEVGQPLALSKKIQEELWDSVRYSLSDDVFRKEKRVYGGGGGFSGGMSLM